MSRACPTGATSRRHFLGVMLAALAVHALGCSRNDPARPADTGGLPPTLLDPETLLAAYFAGKNLEEVRTIGRAYHRRFENGTALVPDLGVALKRVATQLDPEQAVASWRADILREFDRAELADVDGWQLARTEARLAGLVALFAEEIG